MDDNIYNSTRIYTDIQSVQQLKYSKNDDAAKKEVSQQKGKSMRYKIVYITACCLSLGYFLTQTMQTPPHSRQFSPAQSIVEVSEPVTPVSEKTTLEIVERFIERIEKLSSVLPLNREILTRAGKVTHERKKDRSGFGIMDGLIYATARLHQLEMLTGDPHFQGLPGIIFL